MLLLIVSVLTLLPLTHSEKISDQVTISPASVYTKFITDKIKTDEPTRGTTSTQSLFTTDKIYYKRPDITVTHNSELAEFSVKCEIPETENIGYTCNLFIGDGHQPFIKTVSRKTSGKILCSFTIHESAFFIQLNSVETKSVSCNYSPKINQSKSSPFSDKYNLIAFFPVQNDQTAKYQSTNTTETSTISTQQEDISAFHVTESNPGFGNTTNGTNGFVLETTQFLHFLNVSWSTTSILKTSSKLHVTSSKTAADLGRRSWFLMLLLVICGGILFTGLIGISLCCFNRRKPKKMSLIKTSMAYTPKMPGDTEDSEELSKENDDKVYHVYCTIPDVSTERHEFYSLAQIPKQPLQN